MQNHWVTKVNFLISFYSLHKEYNSLFSLFLLVKMKGYNPSLLTYNILKLRYLRVKLKINSYLNLRFEVCFQTTQKLS
jgi:hypothetical protein